MIDAGTAVSVLALVAVLVAAVLRPGGVPEAAVAIPVAGLLVAGGVVSPADAWAEVVELAPVVAFLVAVLALSHLCDSEGLFAAAGSAMVRVCGHRPRAMLRSVFVVAALVTVVLSLDATVVLLTPVVLAAAARARMPARVHVYACAHLANSASLLLPISNLTNLLALPATGLSVARFTALMALPWAAAVATEYVVLSRYFADDLRPSTAAPSLGPTAAPPPEPTVGPPGPTPGPPLGPSAPRPGDDTDPSSVRLGVAVLAGFVVAAVAGVPPAAAALGAVVVLGARALSRGRATVRSVARAASLPFAAFVLALGVVVSAVAGSGLGAALGRALPAGATFPALLGVAAVAAVVANLVNNLPAALVLTPLAAAAGGAPAVLAVLVGVNLGPNLTYVGSLATLLWRRVLSARAHPPVVGEFTAVGALAVPATILTATAALWLSVRVIGV
ncbi:SLC13 family permease [uncultured Cellulomonas sp.]|uniref:SLC13 family permease n=1 Tax=uncultured Cellulomonas sp. TaxID=189682 RepID=UPI002603770E|nr:SLC13 family permease [uncultured Cellulomonas sp.]